MNIIGIIMAALSAGFWCLEAYPGAKAIQTIPTFTFMDKLMFLLRFIGIIPKFIPLAIDLSVTIWLTSMFAMGGVWTIGLTISNVISIFLIVMSKKGGHQHAYVVA